MNQNTAKLLFALLRSAIRGELLQDDEKALLTEDVLAELLALSKRHDVSHLMEFGLSKNKLLSDDDDSLEIMQAFFRYEQANYEYTMLCKALDEAGFEFMPLKGSVMRRYYPEPWMRTSCDIDILVHEGEEEEIAEYLAKSCGYSLENKSGHDISLIGSNGNHLELHYDLIEDNKIKSSSSVLRSIWENTTASSDYRHMLEMSDEMFYFYHIAHMVKHFENGGCGIRPFIDLWILDNMDGVDQTKRDDLLHKAGLSKFADIARQLSRVWLEDTEHTELTAQMERYILSGGVYGTMKNSIAVQQQKKGGRIRYILYKVFIPYDLIKFQYPILQKYPWLTPIMEVRRWCRLIFCGHSKRVMRQMKYNRDISNEEASNVRQFLENIGL